MKKIQTITLSNFQSHANSTINLDENGTNILIGASDVGKTAVIRAIVWALYNKPMGADYTQFGKDHCRVTITMSDGSVISRGRKEGENYYVLTLPNGKKEEFKGFGASVPPPILKAHGMQSIDLDADTSRNLNVALQLDPPFLLSDSGSVRAKAIGKLNGAYIVDNCIQSLNRDILAQKDARKRLNASKKQLDEEIKQFDLLPNQLLLLSASEQSFSHIQKLLATRSAIGDLDTRINECIHAMEETKKILQDLERLKDLEGRVSAATQLIEKVLRIDNPATQLYAIQQDLTAVEHTLSNLQMLDTISSLLVELDTKLFLLDTASKLLRDSTLVSDQLYITGRAIEKTSTLAICENLYTDLAAMNNRLLSLSQLHKESAEVLVRLDKGTEFINKTELSLTNLIEQHNEIIDKLEKCPLCASPLSHQNMVFKGLHLHE